MKKKVFIFVQNGVGGAERISVLIGKNLDSDKFEVCFCLIEDSSKSSICDFIPSKYRILKIIKKNPFQLMAKMVWTIIKEKPDIVFSSVININNKYLPFRWLFPKTNIIIRCDNYLYTYTEKQQKIVDMLYPKADCIIAQTQEMKDELIAKTKIKDAKVVVLQNPIDKHTIDNKVKDASPYIDNGKKHFVAVGRLSHQKGFDLLINAFIELYKKKKDIDLYIVGDINSEQGLVYNNLIQVADANGISDLVHCVGYSDNPYKYIKNADCFVLSSRWEGLPNVLLEALYLETPVAAFKCIPIIQRIIDEGVNGYCADKEDPVSLASAMNKALKLEVVKSSYEPASLEDFGNLFETIS